MAGIEGYPGFLRDLTQGSTRDFVIKLTRTVNGRREPVNLTSSQFYITFDKDRNIGTTPVLEIPIYLPTDPLNGITHGKITALQSASLPQGGLFYSVQWVNAAGDPYVIDLGIIKVNKGIAPLRVI